VGAVVPLESEGQSATVFLDVVYVRSASPLGAVFLDVFNPFDEDERDRLARPVAERMGAALGELP
jgi:hypothetical protein